MNTKMSSNQPFIAIIAIIKCLVLFVASVTGRSNYGGFTFTFPDFSNGNTAEYRSQSAAGVWCQANGAELVEITSNDIQTNLTQFIADSVTNQQLNQQIDVVTNGKKNISNVWTWLRGTETYPASDIISGPNDPSDIYAYYAYLSLTISNSNLINVNAAQATTTKGYICEVPGMTSCTNGWPYNGFCYLAYTNILPWFTARQACISGGGDLASYLDLTSVMGNATFQGASLLNSASQYWIGLRRELWTWQSSGSDVKYNNWLVGQPIGFSAQDNALCVNPTYKSTWEECSSVATYQFICIAAVKTAAPPNTPTTTTVANEPSQSIDFGPPPNNNNQNPGGAGSGNGVQSASGSGNAQAIGLGVGLGLGIPLFVAIIIMVVVIIVNDRRKKREYSTRDATLSLGSVPGTAVQDKSTANGAYVSDDVYDDVDEEDLKKPRLREHDASLA